MENLKELLKQYYSRFNNEINEDFDSKTIEQKLEMHSLYSDFIYGQDKHLTLTNILGNIACVDLLNFLINNQIEVLDTVVVHFDENDKQIDAVEHSMENFLHLLSSSFLGDYMIFLNSNYDHDNEVKGNALIELQHEYQLPYEDHVYSDCECLVLPKEDDKYLLVYDFLHKTMNNLKEFQKYH